MFLNSSEQTAVIWKNNKISYNQLLINVTRYANLFSAAHTDKVAIFSENRPEWVYTFYATWKNNAISVPIDFMSSAEDIAYILNDCRPEVICCSQEKLPVMNQALEGVSYQPRLIIFESIPLNTDQTLDEFPDFNLQQTAVIIYTSGTTGSPKGVMLSFENILTNIDAVSNKVKIYSDQQRVMVLLPLHHVFPLIGSMVAPLLVGGSIAISPSMASEDIMVTLQDNDITMIIGVPRFYNLIRKGIKDKINQSRVAKLLFSLAAKVNSMTFSRIIFKSVHQKFGGAIQYMICGGAAIDPEVARDFQILGFEMLEGFGMTEAAPMISFTQPGKVKIGAAGQAMPGVKIEIRDGEIVASGKNIMQGYYNRPQETDEVLKDGWLYTGDLGYLDEEGFLHITGRKKEIIVLPNGKNINPAELEFKLENMTDLIAEVGVFMKNDTLQAMIFPNLQKAQERNLGDIVDYFRWEVFDKYNQVVTPYKKILKFHIVNEELPKTRLGKIRRFMLETMVNDINREKAKAEQPQFEEYDIIRNYLQKQTEKEIFADDHLEFDVALDSLDKVSLITFIHSTFGLEFKEENLMQFQTVLKLSEYVRENKTRMEIETVNWSDILKEKISLSLPRTWMTQNLIKNTSKILLKLYFRLKGEGISNIPDGPVIIAPNHQSYIDGLFVAAFLKNKLMKRTYFYAKEKHLKKRWLRFIADRNNVIIMDINRDLKESIQKLADVLKKGKNIIIFPEGTRTLNGKLGQFKKTFAILSRELNIPVVPVAIKGAFDALPRGKKIPRPWKKITVKFLKPVYPAEHTYDSLLEIVQKKVMSDLT